MFSQLPTPHLLTCPQRARSASTTLESWRKTDWPGEARIHQDFLAEDMGGEWGSIGRGPRVCEAFRQLLAAALAERSGDVGWLLLLEDDVEFHPQLGSLIGSWEALNDVRCVMASLFNPGIICDRAWGEMPRAYAARPGNFCGTQALLLRRTAARHALECWDSVHGMQSQRLAQLLGGLGPIWIHDPSLVQHVAPDSSWGARVKRADDFNPDWTVGALDSERSPVPSAAHHHSGSNGALQPRAS